MTSIEEKLEAIDWKLWEMYQMGLNSSPQPNQPVQQPQQPPIQQQPPTEQPVQDGGVLKSIFGIYYIYGPLRATGMFVMLWGINIKLLDIKKHKFTSRRAG